jgi:glycosyltransferase involved in cell wall biosynthesis
MPTNFDPNLMEPLSDIKAGAEPHKQGRLKVLVLDEEIPYPLNSGKRIRTWNLLRHLACSHSITFVCYGRPDDAEGAALMCQAGIRVISVSSLPSSGSTRFYAGAAANLLSAWPYSVARHHTCRFAQTVRRLVSTESCNLLHCEWTPYASYLSAARGLPTLIMAHNIETTVWRRRAQYADGFAEKTYMDLQATKMARFERRAFSLATTVATVTAEERETARRWGANQTALVPNGVDTGSLQPSNAPVTPDSLLFLGSLDWQPNRDALAYLLSEILPRIQAVRPKAILRVVGRQPGDKLRKQVEGKQGVEWVGEVPDVRPHVSAAAAVLVPLRIGGGSRIKILESLSMGKAIVTTSIGVEGLELTPGKHCLVADTPEEFARGVLDVLSAPELAAELGSNGRKLVVERYDWKQLALDLEQAWIRTAKRGE